MKKSFMLVFLFIAVAGASAQPTTDALLDTIRAVEAGTVVWHEQDDRLATYAAKVGPADVAIDPSVSVPIAAGA